MAAAASHAHPGYNNSSASPSVSSHTNHSNFVNRHPDSPVSSTHSGSPHPAMAPTTMAKKAKGKKPADPSETSKLLAAKISQLEQDAAGEKDQEAEIGMLLWKTVLYRDPILFWLVSATHFMGRREA